jgi:hypothetical protein
LDEGESNLTERFGQQGSVFAKSVADGTHETRHRVDREAGVIDLGRLGGEVERGELEEMKDVVPDDDFGGRGEQRRNLVLVEQLTLAIRTVRHGC